MEIFLQVTAGIVTVIGFVILLKIRIREEDSETPSKLVIKTFLGGISTAFACAGMALMGGGNFIGLAVIAGGIGFLFGTFIILSHWINYELYRKRLFPFLLNKIERNPNMSQDLSVGAREEFDVTDKNRFITKEHKGRTRLYTMVSTASIIAILGAITWAIIGLIGGGINGALLGAFLGAIVGVIAWVIGWMLGWYKPYFGDDK